jgi:hypothetical protein
LSGIRIKGEDGKFETFNPEEKNYPFRAPITNRENSLRYLGRETRE